MTIAEAKAQIRTEMKARRAELSRAQRIAAGQRAAEALFSPFQMNLFFRFRGFASYLNTEAEFPTGELNSAILQQGGLLGAPRFSASRKTYLWAPLRLGEALVRGPMGIFEPISREHFPTAEVDAVFVPGVAFDTRGGRIGYGGGVYDRLLTTLRQGTLRIGLAFDCQVRREPLPQEPHDLPVDYVVTESHWIDCRLARQVRRSTNG